MSVHGKVRMEKGGNVVVTCTSPIMLMPSSAPANKRESLASRYPSGTAARGRENLQKQASTLV